jgi:biotin carboxyl carrier protein
MDVGGQTFSVEVDGERITVNGRSHQVRTRPLEGDEPADLLPLSPGFPGWIVEVLVAPGDEVAAGTPLIVIEAMGRQTVLSAPENGLVHGLMVAAGDHVEAGTVLLQLC